MAETVGELLVKIGADTGDLKAKLNDIGVNLEALVKSSRNAESGFSKLQASTVTLESALSLAARALDPLIQGLQATADFIEQSVAAAGKEEAAQARLAATLRAAGQFSEEYAKQLNEAAEALGALSGFSSEAITESQALFVAFGATADQMPELTRAALALAKTFGGDLTDRARQLITDINGESDALARLGIKHDEAAGKAQRFADVMSFISRVADPTTIGGYEQQISQLGNSFANVQKAIGKVIISTPEFQALLSTVKDVLDEMTTAIGSNQEALIEFAGSGISLMIRSLGVLQVAVFDVVKALELLNAFRPSNVLETTQKVVQGISLTPFADSIRSTIDTTIAFENRFEAAADRIKQKAKEAASKDGVGAIGDGATEAAAKAGQVGKSFEDAAEGVKGAQAAVTAGLGTLGAAGAQTATAITAAAGGITAATDLAQQGVRALSAELDRTPAQAKKAADGIKQIQDATAAIQLDTLVAGLSDADEALVRTEANIRKMGAAAGLTASEIDGLLGPALDAVRAKSESIAGDAFADIAKRVSESAAGVKLFGDAFDRTGSIIETVRQKLVELQAAGLGATDGAKKLRAELSQLEASQEISIKADTEEAESAVRKLREDIQAGEDPVTIRIDKADADKAINDLEAKIKTLGTKDPIRVDANTDLATIKIDQERALAEAPAITPVDADTSAASEKIRELRAEAEKPLGIGNLPFFSETGQGAGEADLAETARQFASDIASAIESGDQARVQALINAGRQFLADSQAALASLSRLTGSAVTSNALSDLAQSLFKATTLGGAASLGVGVGGIQFDPVTQAIASLRQQQLDQLAEQQETNSQLRTTNNLASAQLSTTDQFRREASGSSAALQQVINQQRVVRDSTGLRVFVLQ